jgi:hypothetical protein
MPSNYKKREKKNLTFHLVTFKYSHLTNNVRAIIVITCIAKNPIVDKG